MGSVNCLLAGCKKRDFIQDGRIQCREVFFRYRKRKMKRKRTGWRGLRAAGVSRWQQRHRIGWDATDGRNGVAERTVWLRWKGSTTAWEKRLLNWLKQWSALAFQSCGLGRRTSTFPGRFCVCCVGTWNIKGACSLKGEKFLLRTITAILFGSKWSCLLLCLVLQDTLSEVVKVYPPFKVEGLCWRHHSFHGMGETRSWQELRRRCGSR